ncbi:MAG: hypothetical protein IIA40_12705 [SAR324 cluster bacterium]|nr:hypothetical protein [SAR324 cluster bacterium]
MQAQPAIGAFVTGNGRPNGIARTCVAATWALGQSMRITPEPLHRCGTPTASFAGTAMTAGANFRSSLPFRRQRGFIFANFQLHYGR